MCTFMESSLKSIFIRRANTTVHGLHSYTALIRYPFLFQWGEFLVKASLLKWFTILKTILISVCGIDDQSDIFFRFLNIVSSLFRTMFIFSHILASNGHSADLNLTSSSGFHDDVSLNSGTPSPQTEHSANSNKKKKMSFLGIVSMRCREGTRLYLTHLLQRCVVMVGVLFWCRRYTGRGLARTDTVGPTAEIRFP